MRAYLLDTNTDCTSNGYLSACLSAFMRDNGIEAAPSRDEADVLFVLGCNEWHRNVELADSFRRWARAHPGRRVVAVGCTPALPGGEAASENFSVVPYWKLLREPHALASGLGVSKPLRMLSADDVLSELSLKSVASHFPDPSSLFFLRVADGCKGRCTFCAIRQGKGSVTSVPIADVVAEALRGQAQGRTRFILLGEDLGCWGDDIGAALPDLLSAVAAAVPECRFLLPAFNPEFLEPLLPRLEPLLGRVEVLSLPLQSGSARVLGLMGRDYSVDRVLALAAGLKARRPALRLTTDMLIGFPTETDAEFMESVRAAKSFDASYFFVYAERPFSSAAKLEPKVSREEVLRRVGVVRRLAKEHGFVDIYLR